MEIKAHVQLYKMEDTKAHQGNRPMVILIIQRKLYLQLAYYKLFSIPTAKNTFQNFSRNF